jgi:hypothetical protein
MKLICWDLTRAGKLAQIEYERSRRIPVNRPNSTRADTSSPRGHKRAKDSISKENNSSIKDTSRQKKDTLNLKVLTTQAFQQVFDFYHITKEEFYKSYRYYEEHPDKNSILMDSLSAYAGRQREQLYIKER